MPGVRRWADKIGAVTIIMEMEGGARLTVTAEEPVAGWRVHTPTMQVSLDGMTITQLPLQDAVEFGLDIRPSPGHPLKIEWEA